MSEASSITSNGRGKNGTFSRGHKFAKGNPHAAKVQKLRGGLLEAVSAADPEDIAKKLVKAARNGNVAAAKLLFDRLLGPPLPLDIEERLKTIEEQLKGAEAHAS